MENVRESGKVHKRAEGDKGMDILLFVSSHCPHCPRAEKVARKIVPEYGKQGVTLTKIRAKTSQGKELSMKYNLRSTPSILLIDREGREIKRIVGLPNEDNLRKEIEKGLGIRRSFFDRIFG